MDAHWLRWHHGTVTDPKFQLVARKAGARVSDVIAVWAFLLEKASASTPRGTYGALDHEAVDCLLGLDDGATARIEARMGERGLLADGRLCKWDERQPKREREDSSAERVARHRAKSSQEQQGNASETHVTPSNATKHQNDPRGEERREEQEITTADAVVVDSGEQLPLIAHPAGQPKRPAIPETPHDQIVAEYHRLLPMCPAVRAWTPKRQALLRQRWRESPERQTVAWWSELFEFIATRCPFLTGKVNGNGHRDPFVADLEWLLLPSNLVKVSEGRYEQQGGST